jgi:hypothetical protein
LLSGITDVLTGEPADQHIDGFHGGEIDLRDVPVVRGIGEMVGEDLTGERVDL